MADSAVNITAGTGTAIDTRTEGTNGNHRQVVVLGDPATNAGVAPVDATNGLSVDVKQSALPSGAATSAKQDTIIGHVDGIEGLLTTVDADTGNISTNSDTLAGAVSGTEMQVDVVAALPAGNNNIGDVDVASLPSTVHSADYDSGAGTDTTLAFGIAVPASGGAAVVGGDTTNGLDVDVTRVSGTVTVDGSGVTQPISHAALTELAAAIDTEVQVDVVGALPAGTNAIGKLAANSGVDIGDVDVTSAVITGGGVADDGTTPGNPIMVGGFAISTDGTDPGSVSAEADVARFRTDLNRRLLVNTEHPRSLHKHLDGSAAYTDESLVADPGDGFQVIITSIIASTGAATALNFFLEEGSTKIFGPIYLEAVAGRGFASGPIRLPVTASTAVTLTSSASIAQSFDIDYYIQAV